MIPIAITQAKIGRSTKNLLMPTQPVPPSLTGTGFTAAPTRTLAVPLDDQHIARLQAVGDQPPIADGLRGGDLAQHHLVVRPDQKRGRAALRVPGDALLRHENGILDDALRRLDAHEHSGQQQAVGIGELGPQHHRAAALVHGHFGELHRSRDRIDRAVLELQADRGARRQHLPAGQRAAQLQQLLAGLRNVHVDRIELLIFASAVL